MKRLQVMVPDAVYESLQNEARRRQATVAEIVRKGIDRQLESAMNSPFREPTLSSRSMGLPKLEEAKWREAANERSPE